MSIAAPNAPSTRFLSARVIQNGVLFLTMLGSAVAFIEPSPFELMFAVMALVFLATRITFSVLLIPMIVLLALYNLGGLIALVPFTHDGRPSSSSSSRSIWRSRLWSSPR